MKIRKSSRISQRKLKKLSLASRSSCVPVQSKTFSHIWSIHNFSLCCKSVKNNHLSSSHFSSGANDNILWNLSLNIPTSENDNKNYLSIYLNLHTKGTTVSAEYKISILSSGYENRRKRETCFQQFSNISPSWGYYKYVDKDDLLDNADELLPDDELTIFCEITMLHNAFNKQATAIEFEIPSARLSHDLELLYENRQFSDVILTVAGKEFKAHKGILAARSPVFQAMFQHEMKESKSNRVEINDIDPKVFSSLLRFIYTEEALDIEILAEDLLVAADKYALERLKVLCEKELCSKLSTDNVVRMLILADLHSCHQLKSRSISLLKIHVGKVMASPGWKTLLQYSELLEEVIRAISLSP